MKLIPAIDLKNNKCVRLTQGKEQSAKIYNENPVEQAKYFEKEGCEKIHIVDLDAAFGRADVNKETILDIRKSISIPIQLGGGIRNKDDVNFWLEKNIDYLIIGTIAVTNSDFVEKLLSPLKSKQTTFNYAIQTPKWASNKSQAWRQSITDLSNQLIKNIGLIVMYVTILLRVC